MFGADDRHAGHPAGLTRPCPSQPMPAWTCRMPAARPQPSRESASSSIGSGLEAGFWPVAGSGGHRRCGKGQRHAVAAAEGACQCQHVLADPGGKRAVGRQHDQCDQRVILPPCAHPASRSRRLSPAGGTWPAPDQPPDPCCSICRCRAGRRRSTSSRSRARSSYCL